MELAEGQVWTVWNIDLCTQLCQFEVTWLWGNQLFYCLEWAITTRKPQDRHSNPSCWLLVCCGDHKMRCWVTQVRRWRYPTEYSNDYTQVQHVGTEEEHRGTWAVVRKVSCNLTQGHQYFPDLISLDKKGTCSLEGPYSNNSDIICCQE